MSLLRAGVRSLAEIDIQLSDRSAPARGGQGIGVPAVSADPTFALRSAACKL